MMENKYTTLSWDSAFFGYKVVSMAPCNLIKAEAEKIIGDMRINQVKLAYFFVAPEDHISNETLVKSSAFLVDEKVTYASEINKDITLFKDISINAYGPGEADPVIKKLAIQSGIYSRFKIDSHFRSNEFERLYTEWIEKSVRKEISDEVMVYRIGAEIKGFVTIKVRNNTGTIGLIAVDENERGKSIGKKLMSAAMHFCWMNNAHMTEVATQKANENACRFYESIGFKVKNIVNVYHLWIS